MQTRYFFGVTMAELFFLISSAMLAGLVFFFFFPQDPFSVCVGIAFSTFVVGHMCMLASRTIILPGLIAFVTCIQWVIAPWLSYHNPPSFNLFVMVIPPDEYFSFMVPCVLVLWLGLHAPQKAYDPGLRNAITQMTIGKAERRFFDILIVFGFLITSVRGFLPGGLTFLYYILGQLKFVGAFSHYYSKSPDSRSRLIVVYISLFVSTSAGGIFYELVLWSGFLLISIAYVQRWRWRLLVGMLIAFSMVLLLNDIKYIYRAEIRNTTMTKMRKVQFLGELAADRLAGKPVYRPSDDEFGDKLVRYNQGWITARVMDTVPKTEPFAEGRTVIDAVVASIVPRIFLPEKTTMASKETFTRYTNLKLSEGSSMALGIAGEMYANFGRWGGIFSTFLYGLLIGSIFSKFAKRANENLLWWAWAPFVLLSAIEAEWNLVDILNNVIKSLMVMFILIYFMPILKRRMVTNASPKA